MPSVLQDLSLLIILGGAIQGFVLGTFLLFFRKGHIRANRLLGLLLMTIAYASLISTLFYTQYLSRVPHLAYTQSIVAFLTTPIFYFYLRSLREEQFHFKPIHFLHLIPLMAFIAWTGPFYFTSAVEKAELLRQIYGNSDALRHVPFNKNIYYSGLIAQALFYTVYVLKWFFEPKHSPAGQRKVVRAFSFFWLLLFGVLAIRFAFFYNQKTSIALPIFISVGIYMLAYWALIKQGFFLHVFQSNSKYSKAILSKEKAKLLSGKLIHLLEKEQIYKDPHLTAPKLAAKIEVSNHTLSQLINEELNETFYDLINKRRVNDAKSMLKDMSFQHLSIEGIGYDSGFRSKSSFYTAFKKFTGQTPTEFRKSG